MSRIRIFAGTTEGRQLVQRLQGRNVEVEVCVATEYGEALLPEGENIHALAGRLTREEMLCQLAQREYDWVIDATHPYAVEASQNIRAACEGSGRPYLRLVREPLSEEETAENAGVIWVSSIEEAVSCLREREGRVLLTTGSKTLAQFMTLPGAEERLYARVLSTPEVVTACASLGLVGRHLIAMQGPFSHALNLALLKEIGASYLVTKESGEAGGFPEKLSAAREAGVTVIVIGRPRENGLSQEELWHTLAGFYGWEEESLTDEKRSEPPEGERIPGKTRTYKGLPGGKRLVSLVGIGMGNRRLLTQEAREKIESCDLLIGAERMLRSLCEGEISEETQPLGRAKEKIAAYRAEEIAWRIRQRTDCSRIVVALSGDVGFYSGATRLRELLGKEETLSVELVCGISSPQYLCSRLQLPWEEVALLSLHGRRGNLAECVRRHRRSFVLLGGAETAGELCQQLLDNGLESVKLTIAQNLSYEEERIWQGSAREGLEETFSGVLCALIENPLAGEQIITPGIPDEEFLRDKTPMTKREVRTVSLAALQLTEEAVIYDIGAGTGSVSVEAARLAQRGQVYAIEKKPEAVALLRENRKKFGLMNLEIVEGEAPEALLSLPAPTHAFIGGSSGRLEEIVGELLRKNPEIRLVINAIALETLSEAFRLLRTGPFRDVEVVQLSVARGKAVAGYQMMTGLNPVFILSATGCTEKE